MCNHLEVSIETLLSLLELYRILHSEDRLAREDGEVWVELLQVLVKVVEFLETLLQRPLVGIALHDFDYVDDLRVVDLAELPLDY